MSYSQLSVNKPGALKLIHQQIEKGEVLVKKSASRVGEKSKDTVHSRAGDIFQLDFMQWVDGVSSVLYKIYESSQYAWEFEEIKPDERDKPNPSRTTNKEDYLIKELILKLDYLKELIDPIAHFGETPTESHDDDDSHLLMLMEESRSLLRGDVKGQPLPGPAGQYEGAYEELDALFSILDLANSHSDIMVPEFEINDDEAVNRRSGKINSIAAPRRVFLVHGPNVRLNNDFSSFLRALNLEPIAWQDTIESTGKKDSYRDDSVSRAFVQAQAMVFIMTPDDLTISEKPFHCECNATGKKNPYGPPGASLLFTAGLAFGHNPQKTILVQIGEFDPFSSIWEKHALHLDNSAMQRRKLAKRLLTAGCAVDEDNSDWLSAGDFDISSEEGKSGGDDPEEQNSPALSALTDVPDLTGEAVQLLTEAARDVGCTLSIIRSMDGLSILTNGKIFGIGAKSVSCAAWEVAIHDLLGYGLIRDAGQQAEGFLITHEGYRIAGLLSKTTDGSNCRGL